MQFGVMGHEPGEVGLHTTRQPHGRVPRADEEEIITAGENGVGVAIAAYPILIALGAQPRQIDGKEGIDLPR